MAMTKRFRVSFDFKIVLSSEEVIAAEESLVQLARAYSTGDTEGLPLEFVERLLTLSITEGPEAAITQMVKTGILQALKEELDDSNVSNMTARVIR